MEAMPTTRKRGRSKGKAADPNRSRKDGIDFVDDRSVGPPSITKFRNSEGYIRIPLYSILRILKLAHTIDRELALPIVTLFDQENREVSGNPGEGIWGMLRRTRLMDRAEIEWGKASVKQRKKWVAEITVTEIDTPATIRG